MKATIDIKRNGLSLSGQPLILTTSSQSNNPLACCLPISTNTSSFNESIPNNTFLPFSNIIWVEETSSGKPNEVEITYVYPIFNEFSTKKETVLPYNEARRNIYTASQILTVEFENTTNEYNNINISDLLMNYAYIHSQYYLNNKRQQSIFVLINPNSGKGLANKIFNEQVKPILLSAHCNIHIQMTEYKGHAIDLARTININDYDTILCASGDGIPYEVINGFYQRDDKAEAFSKINIVQTPGGSGNAMSLSCLGATSASLAALRILKGKPSQCDLMAVSKDSSDEVILSFLSQTYGAIAQADIGTEWMRSIGGIRFDLGVAYEVFSGHKYPCDLAVKWKCKNKEDVVNHFERETKESNKNNVLKCNKNNYKDTIIKSSSIENNENFNNLIELSEKNLQLKYQTNFKQSKDFSTLPEDWDIYDKGKTNNMRIFYAGKMPYIAATTNFFPAALPSDGTIDLVVFDARGSFISTANALLSLEKGTHVWEDCVDHGKVEAFRLIPKADKETFISVDGEWFPYEAFQVEVLSKILRTILWEGDYTETGFSAQR
ncbi:sphinganine kinase lcb4 [Pichia californica]|uniref:Sphinganine kinase lcb4 n=1 Tax=Pichia californica TaxID=460514 RepID=A0A9P6WQD0_9ASCO|nr:sphinganine kinase lcb4 [[Candida] californica]KAG0691326.1 sphinganine kinase lcb4 [[Candida] californica]